MGGNPQNSCKVNRCLGRDFNPGSAKHASASYSAVTFIKAVIVPLGKNSAVANKAVNFVEC